MARAVYAVGDCLLMIVDDCSSAGFGAIFASGSSVLCSQN